MTIKMNLLENSYDIIVKRGVLKKASELLCLGRKALIVTDDVVPSSYYELISKSCASPVVCILPQGEKSKSIDSYQKLLMIMSENSFTRTDCVIAVGGGVIGDLAGFAAATYMRGIDFYNIPTTLLSQIDSSIGGKVAIDFERYKNIVGTFYQPKKVIIDPDVLKSLPDRQISNGLAEAVKMSLTSDECLFDFFENLNAESIVQISDSDIDRIIVSSLEIKKSVVEKDEKENGLRRVLNFGHTIGHAVESVCGIAETENGLYHGECVAIGMVSMCSPQVRERLLPVLNKLSLPSSLPCSANELLAALRHDKKAENGLINAVYVNTPGKYEFTKIKPELLLERLL